MNVKKYLNKMTAYLDVDRQRCASHKACLELILKKLKKRKHEIKALLTEEGDAERRAALAEELSVVQAQRKKGLKALKLLCEDENID